MVGEALCLKKSLKSEFVKKDLTGRVSLHLAHSVFKA
jgi:hypothetical protein